MRDRQEIIVRKGEVEFLVWEYTEYDDGNPPVLKRHWFLAGNGLETDTFPEMLQRLGVPPPYPQDPPTPGEVDSTGVRVYTVPAEVVAEGYPGPSRK